VDDAERNHLLNRINRLDRARRRWKVLALAATPVLAVLFVLALANAVTTSLALKEMVRRERQAHEDAQRAAEEALMQAEEALQQQRQSDQALEAARRAMEAIERQP